MSTRTENSMFDLFSWNGNFVSYLGLWC